MLVCLCHNVTERELTQAVDLGLTTMEELQRDLGIGAICGTCVDFARRKLAHYLEIPGGDDELPAGPLSTDSGPPDAQF